METGFKNPIAIKGGKEKKSPWNFDQPPYDERTSCYVNAGSHYGVGHRQPVGKEKASPYAVPMGKHKTMQVAKVPHENLDVEIDK